MTVGGEQAAWSFYDSIWIQTRTKRSTNNVLRSNRHNIICGVQTAIKSLNIDHICLQCESGLSDSLHMIVMKQPKWVERDNQTLDELNKMMLARHKYL